MNTQNISDLHSVEHQGLAQETSGAVGVFSDSITYTTKEAFEFYDLTDQVAEILKKSGVKQGIISVYTAHTTTALKINEKENGFFKDFKELAQKLVPAEAEYDHNNFDIRDPSTFCEMGEECANGHSHCLQMLIGSASETIPVREGKMLLGRWQRIFLLELDHSRERTIHIQIIGL